MSYSVGDELGPFVIESVSPEVMKEWAVFLNDPNPIHLDAEAVKAKGLGDRVISQGPINVAYIMNLLMAEFPDGRIEQIECRFLNNVYAGDKVVAKGQVTAIDDDLIHCAITLDVHGRGPVNAGTAAVRLND